MKEDVAINHTLTSSQCTHGNVHYKEITTCNRRIKLIALLEQVVKIQLLASYIAM